MQVFRSIFPVCPSIMIINVNGSGVTIALDGASLNCILPFLILGIQDVLFICHGDHYRQHHNYHGPLLTDIIGPPAKPVLNTYKVDVHHIHSTIPIMYDLTAVRDRVILPFCPLCHEDWH